MRQELQPRATSCRTPTAPCCPAAYIFTLPLLVPTIFLYLLVSTVTTIAIFALVYALTRGGPAGATEIIGIYVYNQSFDAYRLGYGSAIAVVLLVFSLIIGLFYVRALKVDV